MKQPQALRQQFKALCQVIKRNENAQVENDDNDNVYEDSELNSPWAVNPTREDAPDRVNAKRPDEQKPSPDSESVSTILDTKGTVSRMRKKEDLKDSGTSLGSSSALSIWSLDKKSE